MKCKICNEDVDYLVNHNNGNKCCPLCKEYLDNKKILDEYYTNEKLRKYDEIEMGFYN